MGIVFHASYLTRRMFKLVRPGVALFDDLLPSAGTIAVDTGGQLDYA